MYVITNRAIDFDRKGLAMFGEDPSPKGGQDLRILSVNRSGDQWKVAEIKDRVSGPKVRAINEKYGLNLDVKKVWPGSLEVACSVFDQAQSTGKSILFFVHGYNNDIEDVLVAAEALEKRYDLIVVPFSWPANGGRITTGSAAYLSDKADARQSSAALNRVVGKIRDYHTMLTTGSSLKLKARAAKKHPDNLAAADALFTELQRKVCSTRLSLLCHSMGNYVLKHTLMTSENVTGDLVFDNICLVAADTNNKGHRDWVDKLDTRNRCYIVINEDDFALSASRIKPGDEQLARLGHYLRKLNSDNAYYINVTNADEVGTEHTYFKGEAVEKNQKLELMFERMFNGEAVEDLMSFHVDRNFYSLK